MIVWKVGGKIIRIVLWCVACDSCAQWCTCTHTHTSSD